MTENSPPNRLISGKIIFAALVFGAAGWLVLAVGLFIPIIGTGINADPHELFITLGAAFTGPIGGLVVAFIADSARQASPLKPLLIIGHLLGGLWMGVAYKTLVFRRLQMPLLPVGWIGLVLVYYYLILFPFIFVFDAFGLLPPDFEQMTPWQIYFEAARLSTPEVLVITIVTTIIITALPSKYRRPLW